MKYSFLKQFLASWVWLGWAYIIGFLLLNLLWLTPLIHWWPLNLSNMFGVWFYGPLPLCLPLMFWPKGSQSLLKQAPLKRRAKYLFLIPVSIFVVEYGVYFWPNAHWFQGTGQTVAQRSPPSPMRVMTWNLHKDTLDSEAVSQSILEQDADVIAIQELGPAMAMPLAIALQTSYPYQALALSDRPDEFALFSRYPIEAVENNGRGDSDCSCQVTTLTIHDQSVTLLNIHLPLPKLEKHCLGPLPWVADLTTTRQKQYLDRLMQRFEDTPEPMIALGDFNLSDRHFHYRLLSNVAQDAFRAGGFGFGLTYPAVPKAGFLPLTPIVRLDYIWHRESFSAQTAWTGTGSTADHAFLIADLEWH